MGTKYDVPVREKHRRMTLENRIVRRIFVPNGRKTDLVGRCIVINFTAYNLYEELLG
jgi:hypothetical protein